MNILDLTAPARDPLPGSLTAAQPGVARLTCLVAAEILRLEARMVRIEVALEEGCLQVDIFPRKSGSSTPGNAAGRIGAEVARLTGCDAVAVDLRAESPSWFE
ncbi:hypothetical protein J2S98_004561 [Arthrobacter oryzae]|uniref:hypothetical protein n=1 Tax=Arthrobacter TaxID=1663 RepID=UPI001F2B003B|nr:MULTISPECIES: hypothetical protein [Arthrobacter]MDP9989371.1 hypothetical protein [Arthrobacter oryzae]UKA71459.1 hypothetical protein LFT49_01535 [Arthrobacter sp. FW306-06-A]